MLQKNLNRLPKKAWRTSELWRMNNDVCSSHPAHLIPPTKYDLVGNTPTSSKEVGVITYIVARLPYSIFQTVLFSARSLTYEMLRWATLMDHYYISGLLYSLMSGLNLRTLRFEDRCSHLCHYRVVIDAQFYISSFSLDRWCLRWIILHDYDSTFYILLWLLLLLYWFLWQILTCGIMIWRS